MIDKFTGKSRIVCHNCGKPVDEHCEFVPIALPAGCQCDIDGWDDPLNIPKVCDNYIADPSPAFGCVTCEHDRICHEEKK